MKKIILVLTMIPSLSWSSVYNCSGSGFIIDIAGNPIEVKISGNGFNTIVSNVKTSATFDTIISGNTSNPAATIKLTIKDSSFGNPGDSFKSKLQISSALGIKEFPGLLCIRGNESVMF